MFMHRERHCDPRAEAQRLTVAEALHHFAGVDLLATLRCAG
jgi:lysyl-tRNA synthetase class 2